MRRLPEHNRRAALLDAAVKQANELGLAGVTVETIAPACALPCSTRTARRIFPRVNELWSAVAKDASASDAVREEAKALGVI